MSRVGRASAWPLRRLAIIPLATTAAIAVAACGGGGHAKSAAALATPAQLVSQSFSASDAVNSGQISLSLALSLDGIKALGGKPIALDVSGPFQRGAGGVSTDLQATVSVASSNAKIGIDKIGSAIYLGLGGTFYALPAKLGSGATGATGASGASGGSGLLGGLGIHPSTWLTDPHNVGQKRVGGVLTDHLRAQIDVANVLNDVSKLIASSGSGASSTSTSTLALLESAVTTAEVDIYTGVDDHVVREFDLDIAFSVPAIAAGAIDGLTGGSLTLDVTLTNLNQPQTIAAPVNPQPSSKLLNGVFALESRFGSLASLAAGLSGGSSFGGLLKGAAGTSATSASATSSSATSSSATSSSATASAPSG